MTQKSTTKDELFLLKLCELASKLGGPHEEVDQYKIGRAIGQNDRGVKAIVRHLAQANFVEKAEGDSLFLTDHGLQLVHLLKSNGQGVFTKKT